MGRLKLEGALMTLLYRSDLQGARRVPLDEIAALPEVEKDERGHEQGYEVLRTLDELHTDGHLELRDMRITRGGHGTYSYTRMSQNPGVSITPTGREWMERFAEIGSADFSHTTKNAVDSLTLTGRDVAANEVREALSDISRRPEPDVTGAIQHVIAALESTARDVTGRPNHTLGQIARDLGLPAPLDTAVVKLWGYASEHARHVREGQTVNTSEAELIVSVACAVCTFLSRRERSRSERL